MSYAHNGIPKPKNCNNFGTVAQIDLVLVSPVLNAASLYDENQESIFWGILSIWFNFEFYFQIYRDLAGEANQLARKYSEIHTTSQSNETNTYLPEFWTAMVPFKAEYYKGLAHYNASKSVGEGVSKIDGYPSDKPAPSEDVIRRAHLKEAVASLEEARRIQRMSRDLKVSTPRWNLESVSHFYFISFF